MAYVFALQVHTGWEVATASEIEDSLGHLGIKTLPATRTVLKGGAEVEEPSYPGYIFIELDKDINQEENRDIYHSIVNIPRVIKILRDEKNCATPLPEDEARQVRQPPVEVELELNESAILQQAVEVIISQAKAVKQRYREYVLGIAQKFQKAILNPTVIGKKARIRISLKNIALVQKLFNLIIVPVSILTNFKFE